MPDQQFEIDTLRNLFNELVAGRQEYDFQPASLVSHVGDYADKPDRIRYYGRQVISARIMTLLASTRMTTQSLLQTFLLGVDANAPFGMLLPSRAQLELFSVVADVTRIIKENAGEKEENFAERVRKVDQALINATFGTRSSVLKGLLSEADLSRLRATVTDDIDILSAKNVLTRLDKLSKSGLYPESKQDYERLCEYVHPNWGMNMLMLVPSPLDARLLRFSLKSGEPHERALSACAAVMRRAAAGTLAAFENLQPPFGVGKVSFS
jgi:hypothetical protein